ncbi:hypothetical protein V6N13_109478 [Hibiscus sabdariffa]
MLFLLSWRWLRWWLRCYAWCTLRVTFGAALRSDAIRGGASFVRLASYPRDYLGSPRLEPGFPPPRLGFHPTSEGYPIGDLGKWLSLVSPQCPACSCMTGALSVALCGARPRPSSKVILHVAQPLVGYGVKYTGLVPRSYCLARSVHWHSWLHRLGVRWTLPWMLPWLPCASVYSNPHVACFSPYLLLCIRRALSIGPWLRSPCCAPCSTQGAFPLRPRCLPHRLAARSARALPWPASLFVAWRASHPWAEDFACSLVGRVATPTSVDASRLIRLFWAIWKDDKSHGEDLVHDAIDAAADTLLREVAASVLGCAPISIDTDAAVVSTTSAAMTSASPTAPVLSRSAPACARRLPMPALPEHQEFDACANNSSAETAKQSRREK